MKRSICIIGLDGVSKEMLDKMGIRYRCAVPMKSTVPPYTPHAWTSIATGVNPGKHGVYGFLMLKDGEIRASSSWSVEYPRIFEILAMNGMRSIVVNVPFTYPFDAIAGKDRCIIVTDWYSPVQRIWPPQLERKYREFLLPPPPDWAYVTDVKEYVRYVLQFLRTRVELCSELLSLSDFDLCFVVFSEPDWLLHVVPEMMFNEGSYVLNTLASYVRKFVEFARSVCDYVVIVSDHGFEIKNKVFNICALLTKIGLTRYVIKFRSKCVKIPSRLLSLAIRSMESRNHGEEHRNAYISRIKLRETRVLNIVRKASSLGISFAPDTESPLIMLEPGSWGLYVEKNVGVQYVVHYLRKAIELVDRGLVTNVLSANDVYWGPYTSRAPQLIVVPSQGVELRCYPFGSIVTQTHIAGHSMWGVFAVVEDSYDEIDLGGKKFVEVYDVVPTILTLLGLPLPHDTDGKSMTRSSRVKYTNYVSRFRLARRIARMKRRD